VASQLERLAALLQRQGILVPEELATWWAKILNQSQFSTL
jgi:hypothetical protein